jgi:uncharacterized protein (TIGR03067 family)
MTPIILGLALALGAPAPKKSDEPPPAKLEGDWVVESFDGPKDGAPPGTVTFHFTEGKISITEPDRKGKQEEVDYTVDLTKKPATLDIKAGQPGGQGGGPDKVVQGIIEVKGDTMRMCFSRDGDRPTEFKGDRGKGIMLITLKRVKPEK